MNTGILKESYSVISEVFIGDPVNFRSDIFDCWLRGLSVEEAIKKISDSKETETVFVDEGEVIEDLLHEDVLDSYRIFDFFKESLFVNSWNIVDFTADEKEYICESYFALDDNMIREIIALGIGERKRSIISSNRSVSKRTNEVIEGMRYMHEYILSLGDQQPLLHAIHKRFHIGPNKAKCYLCLLFLLLDNQEGESIKNKSFMDWNVVSIVIWYILCRCTSGTESIATKTGSWTPDTDPSSLYPTSLQFSSVFLEAMNVIPVAVNKSIEKKNWQLKPGQSPLDTVIKRLCSVMNCFNEKKGKVRLFCETVCSKLGQYYHSRNVSMNEVKEQLQQCAQYMKNIVPDYAYYVDLVIELCTLYLETYNNINNTLYVNQPKYFT